MKRVMITGLLISLIVIVGTSPVTSALAQANSSGIANTSSASGSITNASSTSRDQIAKLVDTLVEDQIIRDIILKS